MNLDLLYEINSTRSKMLINEQASIVSKLRRFLPKGVDSELDDIIRRIDNPSQGVNSLSPAQMTKVIQAIPPKKVADVILTQVLNQAELKRVSDNFVSQLIGGTKTWEEVTTQLQGARGTMFKMFPNGVPSDLLNVSDEVIKGVEKHIKDNLEQTSPDVYKKIFGNVVSETLKKLKDFFKNSPSLKAHPNLAQLQDGFIDGWKGGKNYTKLVKWLFGKPFNVFFNTKIGKLTPSEWKDIREFMFSPTIINRKKAAQIFKNEGLFKAALNFTGHLSGRTIRLYFMLTAFNFIKEKVLEETGYTPDDLYEDKTAYQAFAARLWDAMKVSVPKIEVVIPAVVFWKYIIDPAIDLWKISMIGGDVEDEYYEALTQGLSVPDSLPSTMKNQLDSSQQRSVRIDSKTGQYFLGTRDNLMRYKGNEWQVEYQGNWYKVSDMKRQ